MEWHPSTCLISSSGVILDGSLVHLNLPRSLLSLKYHHQHLLVLVKDPSSMLHLVSGTVSLLNCAQQFLSLNLNPP